MFLGRWKWGKGVILGEWSDSSVKLLIRSLCCKRYHWKCVLWEVGEFILLEWSDPCVKLLIGSMCCERYWECGPWELGVGERSYFEKVVLLLCQTSDQVPVLQEIMKVVMDTQRMPVNLIGWLKTVKENVAFVKVWKYIVIHLLLVSRGLISHSGRGHLWTTHANRKFANFLLLNALTLPNLYC